MPDIEVNGSRLEYVERGTGEPLVFVHGGLNDRRSWKNQLEVFGSKYRAVAFSCRCHYPNDPMPDDADLSFDVVVDDLAAFLRAIRLTPSRWQADTSRAKRPVTTRRAR